MIQYNTLLEMLIPINSNHQLSVQLKEVEKSKTDKTYSIGLNVQYLSESDNEFHYSKQNVSIPLASMETLKQLLIAFKDIATYTTTHKIVLASTITKAKVEKKPTPAPTKVVVPTDFDIDNLDVNSLLSLLQGLQSKAKKTNVKKVYKNEK